MAAVAPKSRDFWLALAMIVIGIIRGYGWQFASPQLIGWASKGIGGLAMLSMIWIAYAFVHPSRIAAIAASVWSFYEIQVALCSFLYMYDPWPLPQNVPVCSSRVDLDLGAVGLVLIAWAVFYIKRSWQNGSRH